MADRQKPQFQWWKLFAWMVGTPPLMVGTLYLTGGALPSFEPVEAYDYRHVWITSLTNYAMVGAFLYLWSLFLASRAYDRSQHSKASSGSGTSH
ncbi:MAG: hypothetical protein KDA86_06795 [Planctomycetaceae bacterium]|nr:hypothetical protein [Planctomycetaceae bacterium]